ncbi:hypothetical protein M514_10526 [Trichuris suis]|uniref:Uncharacterized protein n=1 Tax=Trichuris suis TaxID=68888 RepID=A0A085N3D1_9BILA|nr:hypothetical protein M513_10526 [Trichuris suis]KFD63977.1 hypothetical protein M514_10526 [Trichuris suis]
MANTHFLIVLLPVDEKWVAYENQQRLAQWLNAGKPPRKVPKATSQRRKPYCPGLTHHEFFGMGNDRKH